MLHSKKGPDTTSMCPHIPIGRNVIILFLGSHNRVTFVPIFLGESRAATMYVAAMYSVLTYYLELCICHCHRTFTTCTLPSHDVSKFPIRHLIELTYIMNCTSQMNIDHMYNLRSTKYQFALVNKADARTCT